nr:Chain A, CLAVATA-like encoded peptide of Meloidogyne hapla - MhCLE5 [Meloidogyne hapla]
RKVPTGSNPQKN